MEENQKSLRMKRVHDVRWLSIFPVLDGALKEWDALTMLHMKSSKMFVALMCMTGLDVFVLLFVALMCMTWLDVFVLLGCCAVRPLLFYLHLSMKMVQGQDFMFEDLANRIKEFRINDTYIQLNRDFGFPFTKLSWMRWP